MENKLKIQIWSDIMCPFCYIGKRRIEGALQNFKYKDAVEIEWKSFQLDPNFVASPNDNLVEHLAEKYRKDEVWAQDMLDSMTQNAENSGLDFHFEKAIMANSQHVHRLLHLAKKFNCADDLKELLFKAYLTDGLDINEFTVLKNIALQVGLNVEEIDEVLHSNTFADEVQKNMLEIQKIGVQGVPFFLIQNRLFLEHSMRRSFLKKLQKVWDEGSFDSKVTLLNSTDGDSCGIDGCD
jgi:predicted DsbA family dithiol-disulfide isomerase